VTPAGSTPGRPRWLRGTWTPRAMPLDGPPRRSTRVAVQGTVQPRSGSAAAGSTERHRARGAGSRSHGPAPPGLLLAPDAREPNGTSSCWSGAGPLATATVRGGAASQWRCPGSPAPASGLSRSEADAILSAVSQDEASTRASVLRRQRLRTTATRRTGDGHSPRCFRGRRPHEREPCRGTALHPMTPQDLQISAEVDRDRIGIGEALTYTVRVLVEPASRSRSRRVPSTDSA